MSRQDDTQGKGQSDGQQSTAASESAPDKAPDLSTAYPPDPRLIVTRDRGSGDKHDDQERPTRDGAASQ